ncbi:MAG: PadR family transcriptional regulator [Egibacteraceae bacterium]
MLELAILGLLKERSMHGYELKKQLGVRLGFFWTVSFGSLYPTLKKLERRGAVEKIFPVPQTSRRKQVYRITEEGEVLFLALAEEGAETSWEEEKFPLRLAFFRFLKPETRIRLLERRKSYLEERLEMAHRSLSRAKGSRSDSYTLSLMRHGVDVTAHDIAWLDELITAERAAIERGDDEQHQDQTEQPASDQSEGQSPSDPPADPFVEPRAPTDPDATHHSGAF